MTNNKFITEAKSTNVNTPGGVSIPQHHFIKREASN